MTLKRVQRGDPFPTDEGTVNAWTEAAMAHASDRGGTGEGDFTPAADPGILLIENTSGVARNRFDVLGIDAPIFTPTDNLAQFKNGPAFQGVTPTTTHRGRFAVLLEPAPVDGIIPARVAGLTVAKVDVVDTDHRYAIAKAGDAGSLTSAEAGTAQLLWEESGTGVRWTYIRIGVWQQAPTIILCKVDEPTGVLVTDTTFAVDYISVLQPPGGVLASYPTTVNNLLGFPAPDNAAVIAFRNAAADAWEAIPAPATKICDGY